MSSQRPEAGPSRFHPRNRHQGHYDFDALVACSRALSDHIIRTPDGERSIDFSQPAAVRALNAALLRLQYGINGWQLPDGYLCPPVPGRADYVHAVADLLAGDGAGKLQQGAAVRVLDVGVGANVIYPLLGHAEYGWRFVGSDVDAAALAIAQRVLDSNVGFADAIRLRLQTQRGQIFNGVVETNERFDLTMCNPPFHASAEEARRGSQRKWRNLGREKTRGEPAKLNFGGQSNELWCTGGEASFLRRMIRESVGLGRSVCWFTSLVAKSQHLSALHKQLRNVEATEVRELAMAQGNKQSRALAWTFMTQPQRQDWHAQRLRDQSAAVK